MNLIWLYLAAKILLGCFIADFKKIFVLSTILKAYWMLVEIGGKNLDKVFVKNRLPWFYIFFSLYLMNKVKGTIVIVLYTMNLKTLLGNYFFFSLRCGFLDMVQ